MIFNPGDRVVVCARGVRVIQPWDGRAARVIAGPESCFLCGLFFGDNQVYNVEFDDGDEILHIAGVFLEKPPRREQTIDWAQCVWKPALVSA